MTKKTPLEIAKDRYAAATEYYRRVLNDTAASYECSVEADSEFDLAYRNLQDARSLVNVETFRAMNEKA
jgi:hypothetical protein